MDDGSYTCKLICSKSRLAPTRQLSIPRIELCGDVIGCRLRKFAQRELDWTFESVTHFTNSEIVKVQIQRDSFRFNTFVSRIPPNSTINFYGDIIYPSSYVKKLGSLYGPIYGS